MGKTQIIIQGHSDLYVNTRTHVRMPGCSSLAYGLGLLTVPIGGSNYSFINNIHTESHENVSCCARNRPVHFTSTLISLKWSLSSIFFGYIFVHIFKVLTWRYVSNQSLPTFGGTFCLRLQGRKYSVGCPVCDICIRISARLHGVIMKKTVFCSHASHYIKTYAPLSSWK
jgi:hypothetical protein